MSSRKMALLILTLILIESSARRFISLDLNRQFKQTQGLAMTSNAKTVDEYLGGLPPDRRLALGAVRNVILTHLPAGYEECIQCGMIAYVVPHSLYPAGYHCNPRQPLQYAALASQKNHMALYACTVYGDPATRDWFCKEYKKTGKKLDMGKSCIRFTKLEDLPLELIGRLIARTPVKGYIARIEKLAK